MNPNRSTQRPAFTLIELLIVIAIVGALAALAAVGISAASKAIQGRAIALELESLSQSIEAYKLKYQAYPPDGSSKAAFEAHCQQAFPNIQPSEYSALYSVAHSPIANGVMDSAEALVFFLGGFSKNPTRPFTGSGGPLKAAGAGYQYNVDRNEPFFPFTQSNLSIGESSGITVSTDEATFGSGSSDLMPVYIPKGRSVPIVYFNANTYSGNEYLGASLSGVARPYKSELKNTSVTFSLSSPNTSDRYYQYMNPKSFQLISAGLDDDFGASPSPPQFFTFPQGLLIDITVLDGSSLPAALEQPISSGYQVSGAAVSPHRDNVTNFSEGPLSDSLP